LVVAVAGLHLDQRKVLILYLEQSLQLAVVEAVVIDQLRQVAALVALAVDRVLMEARVQETFQQQRHHKEIMVETLMMALKVAVVVVGHYLQEEMVAQMAVVAALVNLRLSMELL
jgi:hypothetical protein